VMAVAEGSKALGIVGCQVLEDEIAYVVANDPQVANVVVLDGAHTNTLVNKINRIAPTKRVVAIKEDDLVGLALPAGNSVVVWMKPIRLHQSPPMLREEVIAAMKRMESLTQSILIFYGLCGNAFRNFEKVREGIKVPVTILRDENNVVDDCTGTVLGGSDAYRAFLIKEQGAYVLNSMWAANWKHFMQEVQMLRDPNDISEVKGVFEYMEYNKAMKLHTGLGDPEFERQVAEFAKLFGLEMRAVTCTMTVVDHSYQEAKNKLW